MGQHYVPQRYLQNFQSAGRPGLIWMFDKATGRSMELPIKVVAQEPAYYEPETEVELSEAVEQPANPVIDKLMRREHLSATERASLALYIAVMLKRVPYRRHRANELVPRVLDSTVSEVLDWLENLVGNLVYDQALVQERIVQVRSIHQKYTLDPPEKILLQIREPWPTNEMIDAIQRMTWRVLEAPSPAFFITSDNPAFFFSTYGLKNPEAEVCFPMSSTCALHCCWQVASANISFVQVSNSFVKEVNRRLASTTFRFAFCHEPAPWVPKILSKKSHYLSRIRW